MSMIGCDRSMALQDLCFSFNVNYLVTFFTVVKLVIIVTLFTLSILSKRSTDLKLVTLSTHFIRLKQNTKLFIKFLK